MAATQNNYTVGKGKLYFQKFSSPNSRAPAPGVGFAYFGNTPSLEVQKTSTTLDHMDSDNGIKEIDDSIDIETKITGKFATDNISGDNLALWFGGQKFASTQAPGATLTETLVQALPDNYYQIGVTGADPSGIRGVTGFTASTGTGGAATALIQGTDYDFDPLSGLFHVIAGGAIAAATDLHLSYGLSATVQELVVEQGMAIFGAMKFVSNNPKGIQRDFFFPYVKISADATFALKGDTWQSLGFSYEGLKLNSVTQRLYIDGRAGLF